ncbi:MAG TPA: hypothetical protein VGO91_09535 [Pyrinomonadaceae bacterium]|jgi:hypothetical protein|nr:hypothetical protein [Pyrinomonadaceae bacterium]
MAMTLDSKDQQLLKRIYRKLKDEPLEEGTERYDQLYQPIYDGPSKEDPVAFLKRHIEFSDYESLQLFSGFRGSGKTTELFRLRKRLEQAGYVVLYVDAIDYINPSEEISISDLLIVLAGAFSDALEEWAKTLQEAVQLTEESYWTRLRNYLTNTTVSLTEVGFKLEVDSPAKEILGGLKAGLDLKLALKESSSFRKNLQKFMENRIGELRKTVHQFFEDGVKAIKRVWGDEKQVVFIFDSLEQIRGSLSDEEAVIRSVERVFASHMSLLRLPYVHVVYTVPPWLQFVMQGNDIYLLPNIKLWNNDPQRSPHDAGWKALRELVLKRIGTEGCQRLFGCETVEPFTSSDELIAFCGGHFRDLLLLLRETVLRAKSLPVSQGVINSAITSVRNNFLPIATEDAVWLDKIGETRTPMLPDTKTDSVSRLTRFLDTHLVLYLTNGKDWYDIHPLIRDEVKQIVRQQQSTS